MVRLLVTLAALVAAGAGAAAQSSRPEFFTLDQMRAMCRGESADVPEFRTGAGYRLLAQIHRERCRMYLLGLAEAQLQRLQEDGRGRCIPAGTPDSEVADAMVDTLAARPRAAGGTVDAFVQDVLRARYGCL